MQEIDRVCKLAALAKVTTAAVRQIFAQADPVQVGTVTLHFVRIRFRFYHCAILAQKIRVGAEMYPP